MTSTSGLVIGSIHYDIRSTDEDNKRRCAYFKNRSTDKTIFKDCAIDNPKAVLLDEEQRLLNDLRIDDDFINRHSYELYEFFETLPNCQTSTALSLNAGCNTAHYVLFSILFEAERKAREEFEKQKDDTGLKFAHLRELSTKAIDSISRLIKPTPGVTPETRESAIAMRVEPEMKPIDRSTDILALFTIEV
jgi:hypothetical protein